ncbi:MAG TPA: hypothetical protein VJU82_06490, partial [Acidobacteriaceae bacterium]|nr:hypothetical protein [Acidobacteriaceae bacterium]
VASARHRRCVSFGMSGLPFGESGGSVTLERFKQTFGARPQRTFEARFERLPLTSLERGRSALESEVARRLARMSRATRASEAPHPDAL